MVDGDGFCCTFSLVFEVIFSLCFVAAQLIHDILPAKDIIENMINDAVEIIQRDASRVMKAKL